MLGTVTKCCLPGVHVRGLPRDSSRLRMQARMPCRSCSVNSAHGTQGGGGRKERRQHPRRNRLSRLSHGAVRPSLRPTDRSGGHRSRLVRLHAIQRIARGFVSDTVCPKGARCWVSIDRGKPHLFHIPYSSTELECDHGQRIVCSGLLQRRHVYAHLPGVHPPRLVTTTEDFPMTMTSITGMGARVPALKNDCGSGLVSPRSMNSWISARPMSTAPPPSNTCRPDRR